MDIDNQFDNNLHTLHQFNGIEEDFWPVYLNTVRSAFGADRLVFLLGGNRVAWQAVFQSPPDSLSAGSQARILFDLASRTMQEGIIFYPVDPEHNSGQEMAFLGIKLGVSPDPKKPDAILILFLSWAEQITHLPVYVRSLAQMTAALPGQYIGRKRMPADIQERGAQNLYELLELSVRLNSKNNFFRIAFDLCCELAVRYSCTRVALGWVKGHYIDLVSISHIEKFDRKTKASQAMVNAMEEALDQENVVGFPGKLDTHCVNNAHESYVMNHGDGAAISVPISSGDSIIGVLFIEHKEKLALTSSKLWELSLIARTCAHHLQDSYLKDRWFGARLLGKIRHGADHFLGPTHSLVKLVSVLILIITVALIYVPWEYRVEVGATLRSRDLLFVPAPFDGYLQRVQVEIGDRVEAGQLMVELDNRDLEQEASIASAEIARFAREAEKANATRQLAEMQIALARQRQSRARLELVRYKLAHAQIRAPYAGIVVEGELKKNLGSPVRKGDLLLKLAQTHAIYLELEIDQKDVHEIKDGLTGEVAFVGRPDQHFILTVERVDPVAVQRENHSVFLGRGKLMIAEQTWWRPGMGGTAKIDVGKRRLIWVLTHRTIRFLRRLLWI